MEERTSAKPLSWLLENPPLQRPFWIYPGLLPKRGKLIFGGHAKIGKSWVMLELARALVTGESPFHHDSLFRVEQPVRVLLVEQEIGEYGLRQRALMTFRDVPKEVLQERLFYVSKDPDIILNTRQGRKKLYEYIAAVKPNVLFLDPISKFHFYDENDATQISELIHWLDALIRDFAENDMSLVFSHHFGKAPLDRPDYDPLNPYNFRGSAKWYDDADSLMTMRYVRHLDTPWEAWQIEARWEFRHGFEGRPPEDSMLTVNQHNDGRVRFLRESRSVVQLPPPPPEKKRPGKTTIEIPKLPF